MTVIRKGFKMKLFPGREDEYKRRHEDLWPEMAAMIHGHGGGNYSIFLDEETGELFGCIELQDAELWRRSGETEICRKWWAYMADIMETNPDKSPVSKDLTPVFHLE